jgi:hypothetical protein
VCKAKIFHPVTRVEIGDRKPGQKVACQTGAGCPKGTPETAHLVEFNERNQRLVEVYRGVRAGVPPPYSDAIARYMLGYVGELFEKIESSRDYSKFLQIMAGAKGR